MRTYSGPKYIAAELPTRRARVAPVTTGILPSTAGVSASAARPATSVPDVNGVAASRSAYWRSTATRVTRALPVPASNDTLLATWAEPTAVTLGCSAIAATGSRVSSASTLMSTPTRSQDATGPPPQDADRPNRPRADAEQQDGDGDAEQHGGRGEERIGALGRHRQEPAGAQREVGGEGQHQRPRLEHQTAGGPSFGQLRAVLAVGRLTASGPGPPGKPRALHAVSYTHLRAHETDSYIVCRLLLE